ncbi:MAG: hypothetical protein K2K82_04200 [Muribaculaceae bacterium]|nr:hypothetical protein [Muribaculaceae bacterium]
MADKLIFPIGFDLEAAVKEAQGNADKYLRQIESAMNRKPIALKAEVDASKFQMFSRQFSNSIDGISAKLSQAQRLWNAMSFDVKFDADGNLSRRAQIVFDAFQQLTQASVTMGQRLGEVNRSLAKSEAETAKLITAEYDKRKRQIDEQIRLKERQAAAEERVRQGQLKGVNVGYIDTQKQVEAVRNLRLQYEAILPMLNAMAQKRVNIRIGIDKQFEAEVNRINAEIDRLRQSNLQLGSKGDVNAIQANLTAIRQLESELARINQQKIDIFNNNKIQGDLTRLRSEIASVFGELQTAERKLATDNSINAALDAQSQKVLKLHSDIQRLDQQIAQLNAQGKMYNTDGSFSPQAISILQQRIALTKQLEQEAVTGQQAQIKLEQQLREEKRKTEQETNNAAKEAERQAKAEAQARKQAIDAANAENKARQVAYNARIKQGKETQRILQAEENSIANITAKLQVQQQRLQSANLGSAKFNKIAEEVKRLTQELDKANKKMRDLTGATTTASATQAAAVHQVTEEFKNQDGYISRLLKRMAVYAGYSAIGSFLTNVREVTAQFELQRVSLGAIIQDQQRANQLFDEIKSFALTSPLKILDLTKYTKQVAAYGIETNKLFSTTKMLADISVGLGVGMERLTLFLGQVYATGYLRASEVRQATEAGIPLVDKLAKKLTEANGKLVTAADVMDMISKRAISFEQVEEVFKDMTSAGGEFYNMQVKQSQTLFGMWSKLGDAAALMYDQIGNTSSINSAMKGTIGLLEKMMRNWQTTGTLLGSLAIGVGTYTIALKNASVASKALTFSEGARLAVTKAHVITTPKMVAAIIGQNAATKLSTILTKAHTAALLKQSTATNVLSRAFWGLSAAMLANPWTIALAAIAATGYAIYKFATRVETAADRAEKLNKSVASLKNLDDTVKPLIDTYNELIDKTERTAEEEQKLSEVTHELAKRYPGAITAVGDFGNEVDLAADKLSKLYQAEKTARMENTRKELEETEKKIESTQSRIAQLQQYLSEGKMHGGGQSGAMITMSDEERSRVLKQIDSLREGLYTLQQTAENARRALGLIPSEAEAAVEKFGAWKKTFTTFRQQVGDIRVQLFDDSTINQFGSLEEALKKTAEKYKENIALVKTYDDALKSTTLTAEERAKIEADRAEADTMATLAKNALEYYNALSLLQTSTSGRGSQSDTRLQTLNEIEQTLTKINQKYEELLKREGRTKALADIQKIYGDTLDYINKLGKKFGLAFEMPTDFKSLQDYRKAILKVIETLKMKGYEKAALELQTKIDTGDVDQLGKQIEAKLKELSDKISRTKTAREFYDKILSTTGDIDLAGSLSMSIYGTPGQDLNEQIRQQIETMVSGTSAEIDIDIFRADNTFDPKKLREFAEANKELLGENGEVYKELVRLASEAEKDFAKTIEGWLKATEKAKTYSDKLLDLSRTTRTEIDKINTRKGYAETRITELLGLGNLDADQQKELDSLRSFLAMADGLIQGFKDKQAKEQTSLAYEAFKDSPMYVQLFGDLEHASTTMLNAMRDRLVTLQSEWKNLDPTQLKEMQQRLKEIDEQLTSRNPFKALVRGLKDYHKLRTQGDDFIKAKSSRAADKKLIEFTEKRRAAEAEYIKLLHDEKATKEQVDKAKDNFEKAQSDEKAAQKAKEVWQNVKIEIGSATDTILGGLGTIGDIANGVADIMESLGADEEDVTYWRTIGDSLGEITSGIQDVVQSVMSGDLIGVINGVITAIPKMFVGFVNLFNAGRIRKANKEIKKQAELLEQLEYTYSRLEKSAEKLFGAEYIANYNQQLKVLNAQASAYQKQLEAEKAKGKKADKDKLKEYENAARDTMNEIADMQGQLIEKFTGTSRQDVASQMAQSWLDAKSSMSDTFAAIQGDYKEMIKNMIVEGAAARVIENALAPMWDNVDKMLQRNDIDGAIDALIGGMDSALGAANKGMEVLWNALEARGYDMKQLIGDADTNLTGISRDIASASEEQITGLAATMNTWSYYVSFVPGISKDVAAIRQFLERGVSAPVAASASGEWTDWQSQAMENYIAIQRNTAETVVECRRIAASCAEQVSMLKRVITNNPSGTSYGVKVFA